MPPASTATRWSPPSSRRTVRSNVLSAAEQALLGRLELAPRRPVAGLYAGQRRSPRTARSPEFADFRPYTPGDDVRQVDWAAFARLERLLLRLHVAEDEAALNIVLDASLSR